MLETCIVLIIEKNNHIKIKYVLPKKMSFKLKNCKDELRL